MSELVAERFISREPTIDMALLAQGQAELPRALEIMGYTKLREGQDGVILMVLAGRDVLGVFPTSFGKCFGKGTPIMLSTGQIIQVEDVTAGDLLMGPDGWPRKVTSTCRGVEPLYLVKQMRGMDYTVNESHILALQMTGMKPGDTTVCGGQRFRSKDMANVSVRDYLKASKTFKHIAKGWKAHAIPKFHGRDAISQEIPAYMLGLWLGDGARDGFKITSEDSEVVCAIQDYAASLGYFITVDDVGGRCPSYSVVSRQGKGAKPKKALRDLKLLGAATKFIPENYKYGTRIERLEVLAGLLDSDGSLIGNSGFDFISEYESLAEDCVFVARSLGFYATISPCEKECVNTGTWGTYWRVYISGSVHQIPTRITRKQADRSSMITNPRRTAISLEPLGEGDYYGFSLEGPDRLFLLGDFTVAHNTACFVIPAICHDWNVLVFSPLQALMRDQVQNLSKLWKDKMHLFPSMYKGPPVNYMSGQKSEIENNMAAQQWAQGELNLLYVAPERLGNENFQRALEATPPDMIVLDEAHCLSEWGHNFRPDYRKVGDLVQSLQPKVVSAFTATCTPPVEKDVRHVLGIDKAQRELYWPRRTNLLLQSQDYVDDFHLAGLIRENQEEMGGVQLIYCGTQKGTEEMAEFMGNQLNQEVGAFHGGMNNSQKRLWQDRFMANDIQVMACTNAFGMGVDKPDIRGVYHREFPGSPEALIQEVGRAGRDGQDSVCLTLFDPKALQLQRFFIQTGYPLEKDVRALFHTMQTRADAQGVFMLTGFELSKLSGINGRHVDAIMAILKSDLVIERSKVEEKICKIKVVGESSDSRFQEVLTILPTIGVRDSSGAYELDLMEMPRQLGKKEPTVRSWLNGWDKEGFIEFTPPFRGSTTRITGTPDAIDFERLRYKCEQAYDRLAKVETYMTIPDSEKHDFIEEYFLGTVDERA